jgi:hypothetical protein
MAKPSILAAVRFDQQLELGRLRDRQFSGFLALEDAADALLAALQDQVGRAKVRVK